MILSMKWLSDYVDTNGINVKEFCDKMTLSGSKVEGYETVSGEVTKVVVGLITGTHKHENADKLTVCSVDVGTAAPLQIVTAATNVFPGARVPVSLDGATLAGGVKIKKGSLRGEVSEGMFCSIAELGLTLHDMPDAIEDGILILPEDAVPGTDIKEYLMMNDTAVEFEITSNRPDCLSVIGLAREAAVTFGRALHIKKPEYKATAGDDISGWLTVKNEAPDLCSRYAARIVKNVKIAPSPLWLRMRLRASGVRPINNIVDITNYVMLAYGQPMHAFDYACLDGGKITVRRAAEGENFRSLDSTDHTLSSSMLVIADGKKPAALAGIMGGENSEIKDSTKTVVFESACFAGGPVRVTAKKLGMRTESSSRFEKGLDCENVMPALDFACELVNLLGAGETVSGTVDEYPVKKELFRMPLEADRINRFLGTSVPADEMKSILLSLGFGVSGDTLTVPSFRDDVRCMNDVAEEIARIHGYDTIKASVISGAMTRGGRTEKQQLREEVCTLLCGTGLSEIQTFSFISPKYYDKIMMKPDDARRGSVRISNPLGEDTSIMRRTALPSMLEVLGRNNSYSNQDVRLYEMATVYDPTGNAGELPRERQIITLGFYGNGDFYTMKGIIETLISSLRIPQGVYTAKTDCPTFHPGRCAEVTVDGKYLGIFGEIHPQVSKNYGIEGKPVYAAELDFDVLLALHGGMPEYRPLPKFPASTRDFSFVCDESIEVGEIEKVLKTSGVKLLDGVKLFDVYRGEQVGEGKKSVSYRVYLRAGDRTLTDEEADRAAAKLLRILGEKLGIDIRK